LTQPLSHASQHRAPHSGEAADWIPNPLCGGWRATNPRRLLARLSTRPGNRKAVSGPRQVAVRAVDALERPSVKGQVSACMASDGREPCAQWDECEDSASPYRVAPTGSWPGGGTHVSNLPHVRPWSSRSTPVSALRNYARPCQSAPHITVGARGRGVVVALGARIAARLIAVSQRDSFRPIANSTVCHPPSADSTGLFSAPPSFCPLHCWQAAPTPVCDS
jgi:hypothetical protein